MKNGNGILFLNNRKDDYIHWSIIHNKTKEGVAKIDAIMISHWFVKEAGGIWKVRGCIKSMDIDYLPKTVCEGKQHGYFLMPPSYNGYYASVEKECEENVCRL